jgi:predicted  nucleic acid-binding Zn-ribbon protein
MTEKEFQDKLGDLMSQIERLPAEQRGDLQKLVDETKGRHERMRATIGDLQEALDYLRLSVKYLVFDLEATRRENEYLRKLVESRGGDVGDTPTDDHDDR